MRTLTPTCNELLVRTNEAEAYDHGRLRVPSEPLNDRLCERIE